MLNVKLQSLKDDLKNSLSKCPVKDMFSLFAPSIGPSGQVVVVGAEDIAVAAVVVVTDDTVCLELNDVCDRICLFP